MDLKSKVLWCFVKCQKRYIFKHFNVRFPHHLLKVTSILLARVNYVFEIT